LISARAYDDAFAAAQSLIKGEVERQQRSANSLLAELDRMPTAEQEMKVRNARRFASPQLALALVQRSHDLRHHNPAAMLHFASLAVAAVERAVAEPAHGDALLHDCRAKAWGQLGNAQRVKSEMALAERSFVKALRHMAAGSGDRGLRAWLLRHVSSLRVYQRHLHEAITLLEEVTELYRGLHDRAGQAEALISLGVARFHSHEVHAAIAPLNRALSLLHEREVDLLRAAVLNLGCCYAELRLTRQAHAFLPIIEKHFAGCTDEVNLLRFDWLRGIVERDLDLLSSAELRLAGAREGFLAKQLPFESALISLDLAEVYAQQRRLPEAAGAVGEAIPILEGLGVGRNFLAALLKLRELDCQQRAA
jgi:tetratricopeptide (TPR) repeat protein